MSVDPFTTYVIGDLVRITARFQDPITLDYIEPSEVVFTVMDPNGAVTTPPVTFSATLATPDGVVAHGYFAEVDAELAGAWYYRVAGTGTGQAAQEGEFVVERSRIAA